MTYEEWIERATRGTSGDMVWDILSDWGKSNKRIKELESQVEDLKFKLNDVVERHTRID